MKKTAAIITFFFLMTINVLCAPIYKYEKTTPITDTVSLTQVEEFHFDHNMSYSYVTADLTDEKISLELLKKPDGIDMLDNLSSLAESDKRTIAAVNGDFFSAYKGGYGFSLGIEIKDGDLLQSPIYPDTMASTLYDGEGIVFDYIDFEITVSDAEGNFAPVRHLNKHTDYYGDILMFTKDFNGGFSPAVGGDVVEVVVNEGIVTDIRRNSERVQIQEDGYVLAVSEGASMFFSNNFEIGDEIFVEYKSSVDLDNIVTAFGGGSMLVYEGEDVGKIGDYAHTVAGLHPRTALGVSKDGKTLILLTVDGRQQMSRGMRMSHLAELLISLGCYNAVNLDGGGSTRMLASTVWSDGLEVANNPTENRKVINGIGIVFDRDGIIHQKDKEPDITEETNEETDEETDEKDKEESEVFDDNGDVEILDNYPAPCGMLLKAQSDKLFRGGSSELMLVVYDEHKRKVDYDDKSLEWSSTKGEVVDGVFYADCRGRVTVSVTLGDLYADTEIYVVDSIDGIETDSSIVLNVGDTFTPEVSVFDYNGIYMKAEDLSFFEFLSSNDDVVSVKDGVITAKEDGIATVTVKKDNAVSFVSVAVGTRKKDFVEGFEKNDGMSDVYPDDVKGGFSYSDELVFEGEFAARFDFDFTLEEAAEMQESDDDGQIISIAETEKPDDVAKAVYYVLSEGVPVDNGCDKVSIMLYTENEFNHKLRLDVLGADGKSKLIDFEGDILAGEWSELVATIPEKVARPCSVKRVYVLYSPGEEKDKGTVFADNLCFTSYEPFELGEKKLNIYRNNLLNANVDYTFRVGAEADEEKITPTSVFEKASINSKVKRADNFFVLSDDNDYGVFEDDRAFYISLDTSGGGIRNTDKNQWKNIVSITSQTHKENLFLLCNNELFSDDEFENRVIVDYLSSLDMNVFVISRADHASYKKIGDVMYFTLNKTPQGKLTPGTNNNGNCVEFRFGETVTFDFVSE